MLVINDLRVETPLDIKHVNRTITHVTNNRHTHLAYMFRSYSSL